MMQQQRLDRRWRYLLSAGSMALLTLLLVVAPIRLEHTDIALIYLLGVLICAITFGRGPAILASLLAFLASNFFFVSPRYTLAVASPADLLRLITFLVVAVSTSTLAGRVQQQATIALERANALDALYSLSQAISAAVDLDRILPIIAQTTVQLLDVPSCRIMLYDADGIRHTRAAYGVDPAPAKHIDTILRSGARVLGVLQVSQRSLQEPLSVTNRDRLGLIAGQIVLVTERARLAEEAGSARALAESDRLKSVLLSSVSHDLRTPLAIIKGAVTNLQDESVPWDGPARHELLATIDTETDRLNRLVGNLLDMSRIEAGAVPQTRSWQDVGELVELVLARLRGRLAEHPLTVSIAPELPLAPLNATQIDQVLTNLLENVVAHTPPGTPVELSVEAVEGAMQVSIRDKGPGIPEGMTERIFERFVRAAGPELHADGSGLGLAVARGLVEAHGGQLQARNRPDGGAEFVFTLPIPRSVAALRGDA